MARTEHPLGNEGENEVFSSSRKKRNTFNEGVLGDKSQPSGDAER